MARPKNIEEPRVSTMIRLAPIEYMLLKNPKVEGVSVGSYLRAVVLAFYSTELEFARKELSLGPFPEIKASPPAEPLSLEWEAIKKRQYVGVSFPLSQVEMDCWKQVAANRLLTVNNLVRFALIQSHRKQYEQLLEDYGISA